MTVRVDCIHTYLIGGLSGTRQADNVWCVRSRCVCLSVCLSVCHGWCVAQMVIDSTRLRHEPHIVLREIAAYLNIDSIDWLR
jgi:hypothetical protein